jgi:hypothetical protein
MQFDHNFGTDTGCIADRHRERDTVQGKPCL